MRRIKRLLSLAMAGALMLCTTLSEALASGDAASGAKTSAQATSEASASGKAASKKAAKKESQKEKASKASGKAAEQEEQAKASGEEDKKAKAAKASDKKAEQEEQAEASDKEDKKAEATKASGKAAEQEEQAKASDKEDKKAEAAKASDQKAEQEEQAKASDKEDKKAEATKASGEAAEQQKEEKEDKSEKEVKLSLSIASPDGLAKANGAYQVDPAEVRTLKLAWSCKGTCDSYEVSVSGGVYSDTTTKTSVKLSVDSLSEGKYTATVKAVRDGKTVAKKSLSFRIVSSGQKANADGAQEAAEAGSADNTVQAPQVEDKAPDEEIVQAPQDEGEAPADDTAQEQQDEGEAPADESVQRQQDESQAPNDESVQAQEVNDEETPADDTVPEQQSEDETPADENVQAQQEEVESPADESVQAQQEEVESPADESVQEPQNEVEASADETVQAQQEEVETPADDTVQEQQEEVETPADDTVQEQQDESQAPADDTVQEQQEEDEAPADDTVQEQQEEDENPSESASIEDVSQEPQADGEETPVNETVQAQQDEVETPADDTVQEQQEEGESSVDDTVQEQQDESQAPADEIVQEPQAEGKATTDDASTGDTLQAPQDEVEAPSEDTIQNQQASDETPADEIVQAPQNESESPADEIVQASQSDDQALPDSDTVQASQSDDQTPPDSDYQEPQITEATEAAIAEATVQEPQGDQDAPAADPAPDEEPIPQASEDSIALDTGIDLELPNVEIDPDIQVTPVDANGSADLEAPASPEVSNAGKAQETRLTLSIIGMPGLSIVNGAYRIDPTQASALSLAWDCDGACDGYRVKVSGGVYSAATKATNLTLSLTGLADGSYTATVTALVDGKKAASAKLSFEIATPGEAPGEEARLSMTVAAPQGLPITDGAYQVDAAATDALTLAWECSEACDSYVLNVSRGVYSGTTADTALTLPLEGLAAGRYTLEVTALRDDTEIARAELAFEVIRAEALTLSITDPKGLEPTDGVYVIDPAKVTSLTFAWQCQSACEKYRVAVSGDVYSAETTDTALTLSLDKLSAGQYTLSVEALMGDQSVARAELVFKIDDAGQKPEDQPSQGGMPKGGTSRQGGAQGGAPEAEQGFHITPGEALVSTHTSGTRDMRIYGTVALTLDAGSAMTELVLGGTPLGIVLDGGATAFTGSIEGDTLTLAAEAGGTWTVNGRALKILSASGIDRLVLCAGTGRAELATVQALRGSAYARLRGEGYVSADYNYQVSDAGILIAVAGGIYRLGAGDELIPMEGDVSAETMVCSAGGAV